MFAGFEGAGLGEEMGRGVEMDLPPDSFQTAPSEREERQRGLCGGGLFYSFIWSMRSELLEESSGHEVVFGCSL